MSIQGKPVFISHLATQTSNHRFRQDEIRDFMKAQFEPGSLAQRLIHRLYSQSDIEFRHSVIPDFGAFNSEFSFFTKEQGKLKPPGTGKRNDIYQKEASLLFTSLAKESAKEQQQKITHVITVSCTGFYAPGPDFDIVRALGLPAETQRLHVGFMGCYALFPAMRMAADVCRANPEAGVLVVSVELCSLHVNFSQETDALLAGTVFADGGCSAFVSAEKPSCPHFEWLASKSTIVNESSQEMAWTIGDQGFIMRLSSYVPAILGEQIPSIIQNLYPQLDQNYLNDSLWALHPGGRSIIDQIEKSMSLAPEQLLTSRTVLRNFGNMSSATIGFVLQELLHSTHETDTSIFALAFGPGLTIESAQLRLIC